MSERYRLPGAIAALLLALAGSGATDLTAQTGTVTGVVTHVANGRPLMDASVKLVGTGMGWMTDATGRYRFDGVPVGEYTAQVAMLGFGTRTAEVTVTAGSSAVADFQLEITATPLPAIVSTVPLPLPRIGVPLPAIRVDRLADIVPLGGLGQVLEGRIPGVRSFGTSGGIGAGRELRIRGTDSFGYTRQRPLVLVDGVRIDTNKEEWGWMEDVTCCFFSGGAGEDRLSDFNPEEIDRVEVLWGPVAAALFDAEGAAGVIRVFTRRGRTNTPPTFTLQTGVGAIRLRANLRVNLNWSVAGELQVGAAVGLVRNRIWSLQSGNNWLGVYTNALLSDPREATEERPYGGGTGRRWIAGCDRGRCQGHPHHLRHRPLDRPDPG